MESATQMLRSPEQDRITIPSIIGTRVLTTKVGGTWNRGMVCRSQDLLFVYSEMHSEFKKMEGSLDADGFWYTMGHVTKQLQGERNIRGATNAFPIRTAWFSYPPGGKKYQECMWDQTLEQNKSCIEEDVNRIMEAFRRKPYRFVVLPGIGIGTHPGFMPLNVSAPKTYAFLQKQLRRLRNM